jgi:hypothetical protein
MKHVSIKEKTLQMAASKGMDEFLGTFVDAILASVGGELTADGMAELSNEQITLLAYHFMHEEVMDGGFVQLIHNGYGGFVFLNPFAKMIKEWGLKDLSKLIYAVRTLYYKYHETIERDCSDDEFMAMFEQMPEFDEYDDEFVENEEEWTDAIAHYVDEHVELFASVEK